MINFYKLERLRFIIRRKQNVSNYERMTNEELLPTLKKKLIYLKNR